LKRKVNLIVFAISLFCAGISYSQNEVLTNEEIVIKAVSQSVADNIADFSPGSIFINDDSVGIKRPVSKGIIDASSNNGFKVFINNNQTVDYIAAYDILGFDFNYKNGNSRGFLKQSMVKRNLNALLKLTLKNRGSGEIKYSNDIAVKYEDEIDPDYLDYVASINIRELSPVKPASFVKRFAEPVIVTTAIGALVFLFFANR